MKKILAGILVLCMLLTFAGCGGGGEEKATDFCGTWKVDYIEYEGSHFSVEEWNDIEGEDFSNFYIVFKDGGKAYVYDDGYGDLVNWLKSDDNIMIGDEMCSVTGENICFDYYGDIVYLKKVSNSQEIPKEDDETNDTDNTESENQDDVSTDDTTSSENDSSTTDTTSDVTTDTTSSDTEDDDGSIGKDFKAAMDSYEDFMNDYVAFMKKYQKNPSDLSLLADYADYLNKYSQFVSDFEKWEDDDLNAAELDYYIEVQTRVNKKLLEVA